MSEFNYLNKNFILHLKIIFYMFFQSIESEFKGFSNLKISDL